MIYALQQICGFRAAPGVKSSHIRGESAFIAVRPIAAFDGHR
jgi:hypothetical protein